MVVYRYDLIFIRLIFIFLNELRRSRKGNLIDVFFYLISGHSESVIDKFQRLFFRIHDDLNFGLITVRQGIFAHHIQLLQFRHRIATVGDQFAEENIVVRIQPLLDDWKNIIAVDR